MEETNFHRQVLDKETSKMNTNMGLKTYDLEADANSSEENNTEMKADEAVSEIAAEADQVYRKKSYFDKLKLFDKQTLLYPNRLKGMVLRPLVFLSFPVIFYAGFSYGSNLIWFNVLNGTASLILSQEPYGFSSSMVGLTYLSPLIGIIIG